MIQTIAPFIICIFISIALFYVVKFLKSCNNEHDGFIDDVEDKYKLGLISLEKAVADLRVIRLGDAEIARILSVKGPLPSTDDDLSLVRRPNHLL